MSKSKNKRTLVFITLMICLALSIGLLSACGSVNKEAEIPELKIITATDLHYLSPDLTDNGDYFMRMIANSDAKAMEYSEEITDALVASVIEEKPDYLILSGDITFNGEKESHISLAEKFKKIEEAGISVLALPGNHDLYSDTAASFKEDSYTLVDTVSAKEFANIYGAFGFDDALARDEKSLSYTYELAPDLWAIMVDVNTRLDPGVLTDNTYAWIEEQLKKAKEAGVKIISVSHQNLLPHSDLFGYGYLIEGHGRLTLLFEEYGVPLNLSGHMHIQHIAKREESGLTDIATSALSVAPCHYGIINYFHDRAEYETKDLDFPHKEEALKFMRDKSYSSAKRNFPDLSEEHREFYAELNMAYFAGRTDLLDWDQSIFDALLETNSMTALYLNSMVGDERTNQTKVTISFPS